MLTVSWQDLFFHKRKVFKDNRVAKSLITSLNHLAQQPQDFLNKTGCQNNKLTDNQTAWLLTVSGTIHPAELLSLQRQVKANSTSKKPTLFIALLRKQLTYSNLKDELYQTQLLWISFLTMTSRNLHLFICLSRLEIRMSRRTYSLATLKIIKLTRILLQKTQTLCRKPMLYSMP